MMGTADNSDYDKVVAIARANEKAKRAHARDKKAAQHQNVIAVAPRYVRKEVREKDGTLYYDLVYQDHHFKYVYVYYVYYLEKELESIGAYVRSARFHGEWYNMTLTVETTPHRHKAYEKRSWLMRMWHMGPPKLRARAEKYIDKIVC